MNEEIVIDISPNGEDVRIEGKNIQGAECVQLTKAVEDALGVRMKQVVKPEFHRTKQVRRTAKA